MAWVMELLLTWVTKERNGAAEGIRQRAYKNVQASIASLIRFRVKGKSRSRLPVASAMALAMDAAAGPCPVSPLPRKGFPGRLMICTSMLSGTELNRRIG